MVFLKLCFYIVKGIIFLIIYDSMFQVDTVRGIGPQNNVCVQSAVQDITLTLIETAGLLGF